MRLDSQLLIAVKENVIVCLKQLVSNFSVLSNRGCNNVHIKKSFLSDFNEC